MVVTSVMSNNDAIAFDSEPMSITSTGFDLRLEEEEAEDGINAPETMSWIAIQGGGRCDIGDGKRL